MNDTQPDDKTPTTESTDMETTDDDLVDEIRHSEEHGWTWTRLAPGPEAIASFRPEYSLARCDVGITATHFLDTDSKVEVFVDGDDARGELELRPPAAREIAERLLVAADAAEGGPEK